MLQQHREIDVIIGNAWNLGSWRDGTPWRPYPDHRPQPSLVEILRDEEAVFIMSVVRRRVFESIGGFDESLGSNEDYHLWLRAALAGFRFMRNDRPLGFYRRREGSLSASDIRMMRGHPEGVPEVPADAGAETDRVGDPRHSRSRGSMVSYSPPKRGTRLPPANSTWRQAVWRSCSGGAVERSWASSA